LTNIERGVILFNRCNNFVINYLETETFHIRIQRIEGFMTDKKVRIAAYGMAAVMAASTMSINAQAVKLSDVLPSAGIGVVFSDGVTLAQIQEKVLAEAKQDESMKLSVSEMKAYLEEKKAAPITMISASVVKTAEVQQVLAQIEEAQTAEALAKQEEENQAQQTVTAAEETGETVIATVADAASNEAIASGNVSLAAEEVPMASADSSMAAETDGSATGSADGSAAQEDSPAADTSEEDSATVSGNSVSSIAKQETEDLIKEIEQKEITTTQSTAQLAAAQAASMTDEEKEFSNLVIAKVNSYVNVRSDASEEAEVVGKLYDKSVGTYLSEKDGWYEINSGNVTGYVKAEYCVTGKDAIELAKEVGTRIATVTTTTLKVREEASTESTVLGLVPIEEELSVVEEQDGWVKVDIEEGYGWVSMDYVSLRTDFVKAESKEEEEARLAKEAEERRKAQAAASANSKKPESGGNKNYNSASSYIPAGGGSASGNAVAQFALQFKGNPYVWGGTSLTNGADCSGFVMSVYKNFGVNLPHSSTADRSVGSAVGSLAEAQPGDLICYSGHVGLYIGGNQIVHASTSKTGIIVSRADYRNILAIRRIF